MKHLAWKSAYLTQLTLTCSKSKIETLEKGVKGRVFIKKRLEHDVVLVFLLTLNTFHTFFWCFCCWPWTSKYLLGRGVEEDMPGVGMGWDAYSMAMLLKKTAFVEGGSISFPCFY